MPYPKKLLNDYETVAVDLHPHWWYFVKPVAALIGSMIAGIFVRIWTDGTGSPRTALVYAVMALIIMSMIWVIVRYAKWGSTHFVVTSDRLIFRTGVFSKRGIEIPLERVNTIHFNQSFFERITRSGDILIESGGEDGQQEFSDIRRPGRVQKVIHMQKEEHDKRRFTGPGVSGPSGDIAGQLEKFEGMLERGTLTPDEFQAQKAKLLGG